MRLFFLLVFYLAIQACNGTTSSESPSPADPDSSTAPPPPPTNPPGVDVQDPNDQNCNTAQGMKWSRLAKDCVILADLVALQPVSGPTGAAYLVFDSVRVEIFLPTQANSVIIRKSEEPGEAETWKNGPLKLTQADGKYRLEDEGKLIYQQR
jgi:hypothetical protein